MKNSKIFRGLHCIRFKYDFEKWIYKASGERPAETAGGAQRADTDVESRIAKLEAAAAASQQTAERLLKEREVARRQEEWKAMGNRLLQAGASFNWERGPSAQFNRIKAVFQEIEKNPDYFNSEKTLEDAALRLAKTIYGETHGLHGKFDCDKLIGGSLILRNAFSEETLNTAASLAEIEFRASQYPSHSRIRTVYAKRYMNLVRGEKDASKQGNYLLNFIRLDEALKDDARALELFNKMTESNLDNEAIVLLAQRAIEAMGNETYVSDVDRRRIVLNFIDDVQVARRTTPAPSESAPMVASGAPDAAARAAADDEADEAERAEEEGAEGEAAGEALTTEGAATGRARRAEAAREMTDDKRVAWMKRHGTDIAELKTALGLDKNATDAKLVAAIRAKQTELWAALEAAGFGARESFAKKHPKFASAEKFPDGIWGGATRDALIAVASSKVVDKKWTDLLAALGGGEKKERVAEPATSPPVKIAVKNRPGKPESTPQYRGNIDPADAHKNDVLIINDDFTAELSSGGGVDLHEGARVAIENRYREENANEGLLLTAWTQDGQLIYLPVGKARKATNQDVALFQKARHGVALAQREEHMENLITRERAAFEERNESLFNNASGFALITAGAVIERTGWTSRTDFGERKVDKDTLVAIRSIDNSVGQYVIRTEDGALGYVRKNAIKDGRIISREKDEPINALLARLQTPPAPIAAAPLDKLDFRAGARYQQLTADYNEGNANLHKGDIVYRIDGNKYITKSGAEVNIAPTNLGPVKPPAGVTLASALNQAVSDFTAMRERVKHDTAVASAGSAGTAG